MLDNYNDLGIEILSTALDDICPKYRLPDRKVDNVEMAAIGEVQNLVSFLHRGHTFLIQERFEDRWNSLTNRFDYRLKNLEITKQRIMASVRKSDNTDSINLKLQNTMDLWDRRRINLENKIRSRYQTFTNKVESQVDIKFTKAEVADLRVGLERSVAREIREFESRRETNLRKIRELRNTERVEEKLTDKKVLYDLRIKNLHDSYKKQQDLFNKKWAEEDLQGAAIHWFSNDVPQVNFWCTVANVPLRTCYQGVRERLNMLGFDTSQIDLILSDIRTGKLSSETLPAYPFPPRNIMQNDVDNLLNT